MGMSFSSPEPPPLTEKNLEHQSGKVFIITGSTSGIGKQLAGILYQKNAKVYIAARNASKAEATIRELETLYHKSMGSLVFLSLELDNLASIKASAQEFLRQETKLHVLWNNAGVMVPPQESKTKQGYELQLGTNCLGHFLFTKLLTPILVETARTAAKDSVRVAWVSSVAVNMTSPKGGVEMNNLDYGKEKSAWVKYGISKAGNVFQGKEFARRYTKDGVISVSLDPGSVKTDLRQFVPWWQNVILRLLLRFHETMLGAYTELFAGLSNTITSKDSGAFIEPWGKIGTLRKDVETAGRTKAEGGTNIAEQFWEWNDQEVAAYC